jgi:amino-acid N-acetyltransferase
VTTTAAPSIRAALPGDHALVAALLLANELPVDGIPASLDHFLVAERDDAIVGVIGLECYGADALLRSAVVHPALRGTGLGARLVDAIIAQAKRGGIDVLWLLTTTAERWFPRFGFEMAERAQVPLTVRASREFQGACPASATVMRRFVEPPR